MTPSGSSHAGVVYLVESIRAINGYRAICSMVALSVQWGLHGW